MTVSFDIHTYDLLQRAISTADALHELGTPADEAAFEAAETVLDEPEHTLVERAYVVESVVATGPPVDASLVNRLRDTEEMPTTEAMKELELSVLAAATHADAFDVDSDGLLKTDREPKDSYDAEPEKIVNLFASTAKARVDDGAEPTDAAAAAVDEYRGKLEQLSFTALSIALDYLNREYGVDPVVEEVTVQEGESLALFGIELFETAIDEYLSEEVIA